MLLGDNLGAGQAKAQEHVSQLLCDYYDLEHLVLFFDNSEGDLVSPGRCEGRSPGAVQLGVLLAAKKIEKKWSYL
jgi:hypothetical protein